MPTTVLITGATGFLGRQVLDVLSTDTHSTPISASSYHVVGLGYKRARPPAVRAVDLLDEEQVVAVLDKVRWVRV
jgi:S-adenosylmethionine synthetase